MTCSKTKSDLCKELEKNLSATDFVHPTKWAECRTASVVDVMAMMRKAHVKDCKTVNDLILAFMESVMHLSTKSGRIDFVFDIYIEGSIRDSERVQRRSD